MNWCLWNQYIQRQVPCRFPFWFYYGYASDYTCPTWVLFTWDLFLQTLSIFMFLIVCTDYWGELSMKPKEKLFVEVKCLHLTKQKKQESESLMVKVMNQLWFTDFLAQNSSFSKYIIHSKAWARGRIRADFQLEILCRRRKPTMICRHNWPW